MTEFQLVGVAVEATIYGKTYAGHIRYFREMNYTYGFQPLGASDTEPFLVVTRDQIEI